MFISNDQSIARRNQLVNSDVAHMYDNELTGRVNLSVGLESTWITSMMIS